MKVTIVGAGAMGCRFGVSLKKAGADVWLYDMWQKHVDEINQNGLLFETDDGIQRVEMKATTDINEIDAQDLVIIFTKSIHTEDAISTAKKIMGRNTAVMTLQNGLGNIEKIEKYVIRENILAGTTDHASDLDGPGHVVAKGSGISKIMALDPKLDGVVQTVAKMLNDGGINTIISNQVMVDIWEKVAFNAAMNTTTMLTTLTVGKMGGTPEGGRLVRKISKEVVDTANAVGVEASLDRVYKTLEKVLDPKMSGDHKPSMLQDRMYQRKTEIDTICGYVIDKAKEVGKSADSLETIYMLIKTIEKNYDHVLIK